MPAAMAVAAALSCGSAQADTVNFNDPSADYAPGTNVSIGAGNSSITAKDISLAGKSINAYLGEGGDLGTGTLTIKAKNSLLGSYSQYLNPNSTPSDASFSGQIDLDGNLTITNGLSAELVKQRTNSVLHKNVLTINAASIHITGDENVIAGSTYGSGLRLEYQAEGIGEDGSGVPGGLVDVRASADSIKIESSRYYGLYLDGNYINATENQGTRLTLEANKIDLSGGWSTYLTDNVAVYVDQGAELNLIGKGTGQELTITANPVHYDTGTFIDKAAISNRGGNITIRYGEGSHLKFNGGLITMVDSWSSSFYSGNTTIETGPESKFELNGMLAAIIGSLNITTKGSYRIENPRADNPLVLVQEGQLKLDLETGNADDDTGLLLGDIANYYGGSVDIRLSGQRNEFIGLTDRDDSESKIRIKLENGAVWKVARLADDPEFASQVTSLTLNNGTLNLAYRDSDADNDFRTVATETFGGAGGTVNFDIILNSSEEKNDHLLIGKMMEGDHTVHVEAHSGFEPVDMQGYLIRADEWQGGTFTADTNQLEAGVYLYNYTVANRPGEEEGQTDWYLTFDKYVPPAPEPEPDPEPDPGPGPQPEPKPDPTPQPPLSPSGEAVASLAGMGAQTAMYLAQLSDVRKRLGEVRRGAVEGLWASVGGSGDHISGFRGTGFKQDAYRFNFGFDRKTGDWLLGGTLKALTADQKTRGTQFRGDGDAHSEGFNLYATWTGENGSYADFVAGLDRYHEKLSTHMLNGVGVSGAYRNIGLGLSAEAGHQFMSKDAWFIEPQAQLSYYRLWGDDFALSNGMKVSQKNFNGLTGRLGLASGKEFRKADGAEAGQLYARLGVKHEFMGDQEIRVNGIRFKDGLLGTRVYYGLGAEWLIAKNAKVFGHVERENGSRYTREFDFNVGVKYAF